MIAPEPFLEPRGTPFSVYHRAKALVTLGYEVDLVTYPIGKQVTLPGLRIYRAPALAFVRKVKIGPSLAKIPLDLFLFLTAVWRLCLRRYRYIHTHEEAGMMGVVLASVFGCKHLYDMHSDLSQQMSNFAFTKSEVLIHCVEVVQKLIVRKADMVIAICPDLEQTVNKLAPGKPVYMIENVAVDEALPPASESDVAQLRQQWKLGTDPVLLYTGTFESYRPRSEGTNTPLKLYTYLRSGKPILATDIFSHSQILTSRMAMLVPPTPEGLAQGTLELLNDPKQAQHLGEYGQSVAEKNYSWSAFLEKNRRAYDDFTGLAQTETVKR